MLTKTFKFNKFHTSEFRNNFSNFFDFQFFTFQLLQNFINIKKINNRNYKIASFINANAFNTFFKQQKQTTFFMRLNATNTNYHNYQFFERNSINKNDTNLNFAKKHQKKLFEAINAKQKSLFIKNQR